MSDITEPILQERKEMLLEDEISGCVIEIFLNEKKYKNKNKI